MICPKCGFSQPDELYCALCGVHVGKYTHLKRKKRLKLGLGILLLVVGLLGLGTHFDLFPHRTAPLETKEPSHRVLAPLSQTDTDNPTEGMQPSPRPGKRQRKSRTSDVGPSDFEGNDREQEEPEVRRPTDTKLSANDWFQKGLILDDDSEAEADFYQKAIEVDPTFSPALFRLGAIYYRQARYEMADEKFREFLQYATEDDKELYDIYVYYSIADVDRLMEGLNAEKEAAKGINEDNTSDEEKVETQEPPLEGQEEAGETSEGVMTIIRFAPANGHITVPVILNDTLTANMLVDTGAGITVLSKDTADELGLDYEGDRSVTLKTMAMEVQAQVAYLDVIQVGGLKKYRFPVAVASLPLGQPGQFTAILGMDFLKDYILHIDNENQTFTLTSKLR